MTTNVNSVLISVPWDSLCECARWALDRHGLGYLELSYPWGLHVFATLHFGDPMPHPQQLHVPVLTVLRTNDVLKRSISDIFLYLYAHSFQLQERIYGIPESLALQEHFDRTLMPATRLIFLHTVLSDSLLTQKYIHDVGPQDFNNVIHRVSWPLLKMILKRCYNINEETAARAWRTVEEQFELAALELGKVEGRKYLAGDQFTAADISFCSHASLVLMPSEALGLQLPSIEELDPTVGERIRALRETIAGQYAMRMYREERIKKNIGQCRVLPSGLSNKNVRFRWGKLIAIAGMGVVLVAFTLYLRSVLLGSWFLVLATAAVCAISLLLVNSSTMPRLFFALFCKPTPTARDKAELTSKTD